MCRFSIKYYCFLFYSWLTHSAFNFRWVIFERICVVQEIKKANFCHVKSFCITRFVLLINNTLYNLMQFEIECDVI